MAQKANKWQGRNITRWQNAEYDATHKAAQTEVDPVKRAALLIELTGCDNNTWDIQNWFKEG